MSTTEENKAHFRRFLQTLWTLILAFFLWRRAGDSGRHVLPQPQGWWELRGER
jgi:hypothetical protein